MLLDFCKGHGTGNDFIIIQDLLPKDRYQSIAKKLCQRKYGIGADGLLVLSTTAGRYAMAIYNADGSPAEICLNGLRTCALYMKKILGFPGQRSDITVGCTGYTLLFRGKDILVSVPATAVRATQRTLYINKKPLTIHQVQLANPHAVVIGAFTKQEFLSRAPVIASGQCNVEFVQVLAPDRVRAMVWERGVGYTLSCGSGAVAVYYLLREKHLVTREQPVRIIMPGGILLAFFQKPDILLGGDVELVYQGRIHVDI